MNFIFSSGVNGRAPLQCIGFKFGCRGSGSFCGGVNVRKLLGATPNSKVMARACRVTGRTGKIGSDGCLRNHRTFHSGSLN